MKTLIKTKLIDPSHVEVRDYELGKDLKLIHCVDKDYKTHNHEEEQFMILKVANQKKGRVINTQQSKFPPYSYYKIYKFLWKPVKINADIKINTNNALGQMVNTPEWEKLRKVLHD